MSLPPPDRRSEAEKQWAALQPYLQRQGYQLRPRFQPRWTPSWTLGARDLRDCEDSIRNTHRSLLDATRMRDGHQVMIKRLDMATASREESNEYRLLRYFSSASTNDAANHIIPCLDSFTIPSAPDAMFVVTPLLSPYNVPPFYSLDEVQNFLQQVFEGIIFMHAHDVAHGNICGKNIMMDSRRLYTEPFHPANQERSLDYQRLVHPRYHRSQAPVHYYIVGLQQATWFKNWDPSVPKLITHHPLSHRAPEQRSGAPYDPFALDILQLGQMLKLELSSRIPDLDPILPIFEEMCERNPKKRPSARQALQMINAKFGEMWRIQKRRPLEVRGPFMLPDSLRRWC